MRGVSAIWITASPPEAPADLAPQCCIVESRAKDAERPPGLGAFAAGAPGVNEGTRAHSIGAVIGCSSSNARLDFTSWGPAGSTRTASGSPRISMRMLRLARPFAATSAGVVEGRPEPPPPEHDVGACLLVSTSLRPHNEQGGHECARR